MIKEKIGKWFGLSAESSVESAIDGWRNYTGASVVYWAILGVAMTVAVGVVGLFAWVGVILTTCAAIELKEYWRTK